MQYAEVPSLNTLPVFCFAVTFLTFVRDSLSVSFPL